MVFVEELTTVFPCWRARRLGVRLRGESNEAKTD